jgi:multicomponent Na+:H+ antiporter subunit B
MTSIVLLTASRILKPLLLVSSVFVLLRGHNEPGGGFVGGLLAAAAFALQAVSADVSRARRDLRIDPHVLLGAGLLVAASSGLPALFKALPFFTAQRLDLPLPGGGRWSLSTVLAFDVGVYLVVMGTVLLIVFTLAEE